MMRIGPLEIPRLIALAPMEDVTDTAFRMVCRELGADLVFTEFTSSEALIRHIPKALNKVRILPEERPIAIQIFGGNTHAIAEAITIIERFHPDVIDINCGCWNKNHALRGEGAGLLRDLGRLEQILKAAVRATRIPVTIKTRLGWDEKSVNILKVARIAQDSGIQAMTVHCRTRCQGYKGKAQWQWLDEIKRTVSIPLIGNGDVMTPQDVKAMLETGCDGVMIGRGAVANPWIFRQARHYLETGQVLPPPSLPERIEGCIHHLRLSVRYKGLRDGVVTFRKYYSGYLHGLPHVAKLRADLMALNDLNAIIDRLHHYRNDLLAAGVAP